MKQKVLLMLMLAMMVMMLMINSIIIGFRSNMRDVAMELVVVVNAALWGTVSLLSKKSFLPQHEEKIDEEFLNFGIVEIGRENFYCFKSAIAINSVNINKIMMSDEFSCLKKGSTNFAGYKKINKKNLHRCVSCFQNERLCKKF